MSAPRIPKLTHHRASGQAIVRLGGVDHYLGPWGSKIARAEYDRVVAEWLAGGRRLATNDTIELTIVELMVRYVDHADRYYLGPDGKPTTEPKSIRYALGPVRRLYGHTNATEFGPLALKAVQQAMIDQGWARKHINQKINIVRRMFRWAVENELLPGAVYHALQTVSPLRVGRSTARESAPVQPVSDALVDAVLPYVSKPVAAMIRLQRLTGMRPGEVVIMRGIDIDTSSKLFLRKLRKPSAFAALASSH